MESILVIKHGALGDFVVALGSMRMIRRLHPKAKLTLLTMTPFVKIAEQAGIFDDYIIDNRLPWWRLGETCRIFREVRCGNFHRVYDLQESQRTGTYRFIWRWLSPGGRYLWFDGNPCRPASYVHIIRKSGAWRFGKRRVVEHPLPAEVTDLNFLHGEGKHFDRLPARYVLMIPGSSPKHPYKRWPVENYREIVRRLAERGVKVVLLGTKDEAEPAEAICRDNPSVVNMVGLTGLLDVPQVAARALAVLGNDTGPSHMAAFTGVFTISIIDRRNILNVLRGPNCQSIVSPGAVELVSPDEVWGYLEPHLRA